MQYLICYDISDDKRLAKVHKILTKDCMPCQKSVFICYDSNTKNRLMQQVSNVINIKEDDVRCFQITGAVNNMIVI